MKTRIHQKTLLQAALLIGIIYLAFYLAELSREIESIKNLVANLGYVGIFLIAILNGFNLVVPVPIAAFIPLILKAGLSFWPTILIITAGVTTADMVAFFVGRLGHNITYISFNNEEVLKKLEKMRERYKFAPMLVLFLFASFAPFPNEIILAPLGFMGYRFIQIAPFVLIGNFLFTILYASILLNIF